MHLLSNNVLIEEAMPDNRKIKTREGWICPRCESVNAPDLEKCQCVKSEAVVKDTKQLLTE